MEKALPKLQAKYDKAIVREKDLLESDNFLSKAGGVVDFDSHDHRPAFKMNKHTLYGRQNL